MRWERRDTRAVALAFGMTLAGFGCSGLPTGVLYRCETDGGCAQAGYRCVEGWCDPAEGPGTSTSGDSGTLEDGATDGGAPDGGNTGDAGPDGGTSGDGGDYDAGPDGGPPGDSGTADGGLAGTDGGPIADAGCVPTAACPASPNACGSIDDGCGRALQCADAGTVCPGTETCGASAPNLCGLARLCTSQGWCWENPLPQGNSLRAVWAASATEAWAVGDVGTLLSWNGTQWSAIDTQVRSNLKAIHGSRRDDVYAVGDLGVVLRFDGTQWTRETTGQTMNLNSVFAFGGGVARAAGAGGTMLARSAAGQWQLETTSIATNVVALYGLPDGGAWAFAGVNWIRLSGSTWTTSTVASGNPVRGVWGDGLGNLYLVTGPGNLAYLDGGGWTVATTFDAGTTYQGLTGSSEADLWVAAANGQVLHSDGGTWATAALPGLSGATLTGIASLGPGRAMAVGTGGYFANNLAGAWRTEWSVAGSPAWPVNDIFALDGDTVEAVGGGDAGAAFYRRLPATGSWAADLCSPAQAFSPVALWVSPARTAFAVAGWSEMVSVPIGGSACAHGMDQYGFDAVWGFEDGNVHVVGWGGSTQNPPAGVLYGGQLPQNDLPLLPIAGNWQELTGIWGVGPRQAWMSANDGTVFRFDGYPPDGGGWVVETAVGWPTELRGVHGARLADGGLEVWTVGTGGNIWKRVAGGGFVQVPTGSATDTFGGVWVENDTHAWVVGGDGGAWEWAGGALTFRTTPMAVVSKVTGLADAGVWAVGPGGAIVRHR